MDLEDNEYSLLIEKQKVEIRKRAKLVRLFDEVKKDKFTNQCLHHIGIRIDEFEQFIIECKEKGKLRSNQTLIEDLQRAIQKEAMGE